MPDPSSFYDTDSDLSDAPSQLDHFSEFNDFRTTSNGVFNTSQSLSHTPTIPMASVHNQDSGASDMSDPDNCDSAYERPHKKLRITPPHNESSKFETLPAEILQRIAAGIADDKSFCSLLLTCRTFNITLSSQDSAIWQERFLARYDYPLVDSPDQYQVAYKLRRFLHHNLADFGNGKDRRGKFQLQNIRDMVLETYRKPKPHLPYPTFSKNLAAFSTLGSSPWMSNFLSTPFFDSTHRKYGRPNIAFDTMQLVLTHLLISPKSVLAHVVTSSRDNYDLVRVYNWNQPFSTIYSLGPDDKEPNIPTEDTFKSSIFPNLQSPGASTMRKKQKSQLDLHTLLHIRNFWHRHLIDDSNGFSLSVIIENTYAKMSRRLADIGHAPTKWEKPLQDSKSNLEAILKGRWYGHYSCLTPWPKQRQDLEERQSNAEDWEDVDPLTLHFSTSTDNERDGFWPPIFCTIPTFANSVSDVDDHTSKSIFIRGTAPFLELSDRYTFSMPPNPSITPNMPNYHPFLALRIRGVIHPIPPQWDIPGWHRVVMVLYKPSVRYLVQVLEHDEEEYGNSFGATITSNLPTTQIQPITQADSYQQFTNNNITPPQNAAQNLSILPTVDTTMPATILDPAEAEKLLRDHLEAKLTSNPAYAASKMDNDVVEQLEESFSPSEFLDWNDIDYAYAYEGVLLPGGKIMMGRWWRIAENGTGPGKEVDALGEDVGDFGADETMDGSDSNPSLSVADGGDGMDLDTGNEEVQGQTRSRTQPNLERGPFIFWC